MGKGRPYLLLLVCFGIFCCSLLAQSSASDDDPSEHPPAYDEGPDPHFLDSVWVGGTFGVGRYVESTRLFEAHDPAASDVYTLSLDEQRGRIWVFARGRLQIRDFAGALLKEISIPHPVQPTDELVSPDEVVRDGTLEDVLCTTDSLNINALPYEALWPLAQLATNAADGSSWLAVGNRLYQYDVGGEPVQARTYPKLITSLAADPVRSRWWVGSCNVLTLYDSDGSQLSERTSTRLLNFVKSLHFDQVSNRLWAAGRDFVTVLGPDGEFIREIGFHGFPLANAELIAGDGSKGGWAAAGGLLRHIHPDGAQARTLSLFQGLIPLASLPVVPHADAVALSSNLRNQSAWIANRQTLVHVSVQGQILETLPLQRLVPSSGTQPIGLPLPLLQPVIGTQGRIRTIAVYADLLPPELDILCPEEGAHLQNRIDYGETPQPQPFRVLLRYREHGIGLDPDSLLFTLNGEDTSAICERASDDVACVNEEPPALLALRQVDTQGVSPAPLAVSSVEPRKEGRFLCEIRRAEEGPVELAVTARDYAGNRAEPATRRFALDNHPPEIVIESPLHGAILNSHSVTLTGRVSEPATLEILGESASLDADNRFSHPLTLAEGGNHIYLGAMDRSGRWGYSSAYYIVDTIAPSKPDESKIRIIYRDGVAEIHGEAGSVEQDSRVTITNLRTGESVSVRADASHGSFSAEIAAQLGDQLQIVSSDPAGNQSEVYEEEVQQPLYIRVHFPTPGEQIHGKYLLVRGDIMAIPGAGVTVNGEPAAILGNGLEASFYSMVEMEAATTGIVAQITDRAGRSRSVTVPISFLGSNQFRLRALPFNGVAPATIGFAPEDDLGRGISEIKMDFDGDGDFEIITTDPEEPLEFIYDEPGLYQPRIIVTTAEGGHQQASTTVVITDPARDDAVIQALWQDMTDALRAGNQEAALVLFQPGSRPLYGEIFSALAEHMPEILDDFSVIHPIGISSEGAEYALATATERPRIYIPVFTRTDAGLWAIDSM